MQNLPEQSAADFFGMYGVGCLVIGSWLLVQRIMRAKSVY